MTRTSLYGLTDQPCFWSSKAQKEGQLGPAAARACNFLATSCFLFGIWFAAYVPAPIEQRIEVLFFLGLIPAAGFYAAGHVLSWLLALGSALCEMIAAQCLRFLVLLTRSLLSGISPPVSDVSIRCLMVSARCALSKLSTLNQNAYRSLRHQCWYAYVAVILCLCFLIRSAARLVISLQDSSIRWISYLRPLMIKGMLLIAFGLGWYGGNSIWLRDVRPAPPTREITIETVVERIIDIESDGDPNKKSKRSSATGPGQFLDQTWLELIRIHRPDLARGRSEDETLELRRDAKVAREITTRFAEHNAEMLRKKGLPVTPGTLYLAHFAGSAGAVAILSAPEHADAASAMARADATGRTRREKIIKANPFLERFTVADLRSWADRKMRVSGS